MVWGKLKIRMDSALLLSGRDAEKVVVYSLGAVC